MEAKILRTLATMAERLNLSSHQAMLIYAGSRNWLNLPMAEIAIHALEKIAATHELDLWGERPYLAQLIERGIFTGEEAILFGWKKREAIQTNGEGARVPEVATHRESAPESADTRGAGNPRAAGKAVRRAHSANGKRSAAE